MLAEQLMTRIQVLHDEQFLHRDIKPDNFLMGTADSEKQLFIIDFRLSKRYVDRKTGYHI